MSVRIIDFKASLQEFEDLARNVIHERRIFLSLLVEARKWRVGVVSSGELVALTGRWCRRNAPPLNLGGTNDFSTR